MFFSFLCAILNLRLSRQKEREKNECNPSERLSGTGRLAPGTKIQLENKYNYNVRYTKENLCVCNLECSVFDKDAPEKFSVRIEVEGLFSFDPQVPREQLHIMTYKELFPYARVLVSTVTSASGIPPVMIPSADIENQSIYRIDTGNLKT